MYRYVHWSTGNHSRETKFRSWLSITFHYQCLKAWDRTSIILIGSLIGTVGSLPQWYQASKHDGQRSWWNEITPVDRRWLHVWQTKKMGRFRCCLHSMVQSSFHRREWDAIFDCKWWLWPCFGYLLTCRILLWNLIWW